MPFGITGRTDERRPPRVAATTQPHWMSVWHGMLSSQSGSSGDAGTAPARQARPRDDRRSVVTKDQTSGRQANLLT